MYVYLVEFTLRLSYESQTAYFWFQVLDSVVANQK